MSLNKLNFSKKNTSDAYQLRCDICPIFKATKKILKIKTKKRCCGILFI